MKRIVWGRATSSNVMKVLWCLGELDLPFERIDVGGAFGKTDTPEYRAMNPTGLVPTLQEDDFTLWESNVILRYLHAAYAPMSPLFPTEVHARANVDRWMDAQQTVFNRPMGQVFWGLVRTPADKRDMARDRSGDSGDRESMAHGGGGVAEARFHRRRGTDVVRHSLGRACQSLVRHGLPGVGTAGVSRAAGLVRPPVPASGVSAAYRLVSDHVTGPRRRA